MILTQLICFFALSLIFTAVGCIVSVTGFKEVVIDDMGDNADICILIAAWVVTLLATWEVIVKGIGLYQFFCG